MIPLSLNKFGSRVLDVIWAWANIKNKTIIAAALSERIAQLNANQYGKFISEKCMLQLYRRDAKEWAEAIGKGKKHQQALDDVVQELGLAKKRKSEKKIKEEPVEMMDVMDESILPTEEEEDEDQPKKKKKKKSKKGRKMSEDE